MNELVSVITPTWHRHDLLLERCVPSVETQTYSAVEHVVVSDGPDPVLRSRIPPTVRFDELGSHDDTIRWGSRARLRGIDLAQGEIIAWLDDDDTWQPQYLDRLVDALISHDADFAYGRMRIRRPPGLSDEILSYLSTEVGRDPPGYGHINTSAIVHRRRLLDQATWRPRLTTEDASLDDWDLVSRWLAAGASYSFVDEIVGDYYPSGT